MLPNLSRPRRRSLGFFTRHALAGVTSLLLTAPALAHTSQVESSAWNHRPQQADFNFAQGILLSGSPSSGPYAKGVIDERIGLDDIIDRLSAWSGDWNWRGPGRPGAGVEGGSSHNDRWSDRDFNPWSFGRYLGRDTVVVVVFFGNEWFGRPHHHGGRPDDGHQSGEENGHGGHHGWPHNPDFDPDWGEHGHCGGDNEPPQPVPLPAALPLAISGFAALGLTARRNRRQSKALNSPSAA